MGEDSLLGGSSDGPKQRQYEGDRYSQDYQMGAERASQLGGFGAILGRAEAAANAGKSAGDYSVAQGQALLAGETTRGDAPASNADYLAYSAQQQYDMVHTGLDAGTIDARGQVANDMGNWLSQVNAQAVTATQNEQANWQGQAADQAHGFISSAATWADSTAQASWLSSNRLSQQAAAATHAKNSMPEPTNFDQAGEMAKARQQIESGDLVGGLQTQLNIGPQQAAAQQAHEQGAQVLHQLDATYHDTASTQPAFTPPPTMPGQPGANDHTSTSSFISPPSPGAGAGNSGGQFSNGPVGSGGGGPVTPSPVNGPGSGGGFTPGPGQTTGATQFPPPFSGGGGVPGGTAGVPGRPGVSAGAMGGAFGGVGGGSGGDIERRGRSYAPGANSAGSRLTSGVAGKDGSAKGRLADGEGSGGKSGGTPKEGRVGPGGQAAATKAGANGQPGANAGSKGKKEEEDERKSKFLLREDPLDIDFGEGPEGEKVVPPVIGE